MKLYTEQQVIEMIEKSRQTGLTAEYLILTTTPIELPSDEEVHKSSPHQILNSNNSWDIGFHNGWKHGAIWMRDKIQGKITPNQ